MESIVIYKLLESQLPLPLQVRALVILILHLPPEMIQKLSSQSFHLSAFVRSLFVSSMK